MKCSALINCGDDLMMTSCNNVYVPICSRIINNILMSEFRDGSSSNFISDYTNA